MKFFIDTANPGAIRKAYDMGVIDGVTTNPTLISKENRVKVIGLAIVLLVILAGCAGYFDGYGYSDYPYNYGGYGYYGYPYYDYGYYPYGYYGGGRGIRCPSCGAPHLGTGGEGSHGGRGDGHRGRGR